MKLECAGEAKGRGVTRRLGLRKAHEVAPTTLSATSYRLLLLRSSPWSAATGADAQDNVSVLHTL